MKPAKRTGYELINERVKIAWGISSYVARFNLTFLIDKEAFFKKVQWIQFRIVRHDSESWLRIYIVWFIIITSLVQNKCKSYISLLCYHSSSIEYFTTSRSSQYLMCFLTIEKRVQSWAFVARNLYVTMIIRVLLVLNMLTRSTIT